MIQKGTYLKIVDNSGARIGCCIKVKSGSNCRYGYLGDLVLISVKSLRVKRKSSLKLKKGDLFAGLIIRTKTVFSSFSGDKNYFTENSIVLFKQQKQKQNKYYGTRVFGCIPKYFRYTKYLKLVSLSSGISS
jgi:large subunit ribosomal protein L14